MREKIYTTKEEANKIERLFAPDTLNEYIVHTVTFPDGVKMDIEAYSTRYIDGKRIAPFAQAFAYIESYYIDYAKKKDTYLGEWHCHLKDNEYIVEVLIEED